MDEYRMLNDIHKPSSTRTEVSTSSSERDDEETDKSRFSEKEIGDPTGRPKLPVPDNLHRDYTRTIEPEQRWTLVHEGPFTTETEQSDESELSDIPSAAFKGYRHVWDYHDNTHLSESPPSAPTLPESPVTPPQTPPERLQSQVHHRHGDPSKHQSPKDGYRIYSTYIEDAQTSN